MLGGGFDLFLFILRLGKGSGEEGVGRHGGEDFFFFFFFFLPFLFFPLLLLKGKKKKWLVVCDLAVR